MSVFGIDISVCQKGMNLKKAKDEGVEFVILRGAYGLYKDKQFETFYSEAKSIGLNVGVYHFTKAKNADEAIAEAKYLIKNCLAGKQFEMPIYIDMENEDDKQYSTGNKRVQTDVIKAYCETLEGAGYFAGIYSNKSWLVDMLYDAELQDYAHWVAQWGTKSCTYKGEEGVLGMWQFEGGSGRVAGVACDKDYLFIDYPSLIKGAGLNGFPKSKSAKSEAPKAEPVKPEPVKETPNTKKSNEEMANEVIRGLWGNGNDRRIRLTRAGYNYNVIQAIVNKQMK